MSTAGAGLSPPQPTQGARLPGLRGPGGWPLLRIVFLVWPDHCGRGPPDARSVIVRLA